MDSQIIIAILNSSGMPKYPAIGAFHIRCESHRWASYSYNGFEWVLFSYQRHDDKEYVEV